MVASDRRRFAHRIKIDPILDHAKDFQQPDFVLLSVAQARGGHKQWPWPIGCIIGANPVPQNQV